MTSLMNKPGGGGPSSFATKAAVLATNSMNQNQNQNHNSQNPNQIDKVVESVANANKRLSQTSTSSNKRKSENSIGPWKLGRTLGRGSTGRVRLAKHSNTGQLSAVKIVPKSTTNATDEQHQKQQQAKKKNPKYDENGLPYGIEREIIIMKLISHPNIMALYDVWENTNELYLVLEYVEGGELFDYLIRNGRLTESEAVNYFKQIIRGVEYCHRFNICHRDLKPENILLDKNHNIKIADFGMAALETNAKLLETSCGSPHYASPEIVAGKNYHGSPSDVWSCGIILFALLTGHLPFDDANIRKLLLKVQTGKFQMPNSLSAEAKDLIWSMLRVNPTERISIHNILKHPLLTKYPELPNSIYNNYKGGFTIDDDDFDLNKPITKIDDSILKNLQTLWHGIQINKIIEKLHTNEKNYEKIFYYLLSKYKEEHFGEDDNTVFNDETSLAGKAKIHSHNNSHTYSHNGSPNRGQSHSHNQSHNHDHSNAQQTKRSNSKPTKEQLTSNATDITTRKKSKKPSSRTPATPSAAAPKKLTRSGSSMIIKTTIQDENGEVLKSVTKEIPAVHPSSIVSPKRQPLKKQSANRLNVQANNNSNAAGITTASSSIKKSVSFKSAKGKISRSNTSVANSLHSKSLSPSPKKAINGKLNGSSVRMIGRSKHDLFNPSNSISINPKDLPDLPDLDLSEFNYLVDTIFEGNEKDDITLNFDLDDFATGNADQVLSNGTSNQYKEDIHKSPVKNSRTLNPKASNSRMKQNKNASSVLEKFGVRMSRLDFADLSTRNIIGSDISSQRQTTTTAPISSLVKSQSSSTRNLNSFLKSNMNISEYNQKINQRQLTISTSRSKDINKLKLSSRGSTDEVSQKPKMYTHSADKSMDYSSDYDGNYSLHSAVHIPIDSPNTNLFNFDTDVNFENQVPIIKEPSGITAAAVPTTTLRPRSTQPITKDNESDRFADAEIENAIDISQVIFDDINPSELRYHRKVESVSTQESQLNKVMQQPFPTIRCSLLANSNYDMPEGNDNKRLSFTPEKRKSYTVSTSGATATPISESDRNSKLKAKAERQSVFSDPEDDAIPITFNNDIMRENTTIFDEDVGQRVLIISSEDNSDTRDLQITPTRSSKSHQARLSMQSAQLLKGDFEKNETSPAPLVARHAYSTLPFKKPSNTFFQTSKLENELDGIDYEVPATAEVRDSHRFSTASKRGATRIISSILGSNKLDDISNEVEISPIEATFEDVSSSKTKPNPVKKQLRFASSTFIKEDIGGIINMSKGRNDRVDSTVNNKRPNWFMRFFNSMTSTTSTHNGTGGDQKKKNVNGGKKQKNTKKKGSNSKWQYRKTTDKLFNRSNVCYIESNYLSSGKLIDHLEKELTKLNSVRILYVGSLKGSVKTISVYINDGLKENELNFHVEIEDQEGYEFGFGGCFVRIIKVSQTGSPKFFKTCCEVIEKNIIDLENKEKMAEN